jgi:hypothetical protein
MKIFIFASVAEASQIKGCSEGWRSFVLDFLTIEQDCQKLPNQAVSEELDASYQIMAMDDVAFREKISVATPDSGVKALGGDQLQIDASDFVIQDSMGTGKAPIRSVKGFSTLQGK